MIKKFYKSFVLIILLAVTSVYFALPTYSIGGGLYISGPGVADEGVPFSVAFSINGDSNITFNGALTVSNGVIDGVSMSPGEAYKVSNTSANVVISGVTTKGANGNITIRSTGAAPVVIQFSGNMSSIDNFTSDDFGAQPCTVNIRSAADKAAADASARAAQEAEAARQASIWAEESSRQALIQAEESSRQASIQAEQDAINASIYEEQSKQASIEAEAAAAYNSSVAESASIEESKALESASIQESIEEESKRAEREASIEEWQSKMESSRVEATRAFLENGVYYVPYDVEVARARFLFAVDTTETEAPQHFKKTALTVNTQPVLAYKLDGFSENIYIVYGCYDNGNDKPAFYLYDAKTDRLFPYEALGTLTPSEEGDSENAEEESTEEQTGRKGPGLFATILSCFLSMILGAAILMLILTLLKKKQEDDGEVKGIVPFVPFQFGKNAEDASSPETETAQEVTEAAGALSAEEEADILSLEAEDPAEDAVDELLESVSMEIGKGEEEHPND